MQDLFFFSPFPAAFLEEKIIYIYFAVDYPWYQFRPTALADRARSVMCRLSSRRKATPFYRPVCPFINPLPRWVMQTYPGSCGKVQIFERKYCEQSAFCKPPTEGSFFHSLTPTWVNPQMYYFNLLDFLHYYLNS